MNSPGICRTKPISPARALWNQAQARGMAFAFCMFSQISSWPIELHEAADQRFGRSRNRLAGDRVLSEDRLQQVVAASILRERGERQENGFPDDLQ